jgi:hypothetical protein
MAILIIEVENFGNTSEVAEPPPQQDAAHEDGDEKQKAPPANRARAIFVRDIFTIRYISNEIMVLP